MDTVRIEPFHVIGICIRTSNKDQAAQTDIGNLWNTFISKNIIHKIPNKVNDTIYSIYTNYEKDHMMPYDVIIGCKVTSIENIPYGLTAHTLPGATYSKFNFIGDLTKGAVAEAWSEIWKINLYRNYSSDFEVYDHRAANPTSAEFDIYIAVDQ